MKPNNIIFEYVDWKSLLTKEHLDEDVLEKCADIFTDKSLWKIVSMNQALSEKFIEKFADKVDWIIISRYQVLSEAFIEKFIDKLYLNSIEEYQKLSETFIHNHIDELDMSSVVKHQKISEKFYYEHTYCINFSNMIEYQSLTEEFLEENINTISFFNLWDEVVIHQSLSEVFMRKYFDKLPGSSISIISRYQKLSIDFMKDLLQTEFYSYFQLEKLSKYQVLTDEFVRENFNDFKNFAVNLLMYQNLSDELRKELSLYVDFTFLGNENIRKIAFSNERKPLDKDEE